MPLSLLAQLPVDYTTTVYDEVKHPFPLFNELGVLNMQTYMYRNEYNALENCRLFDTLQSDSLLIRSYEFDPLKRTIKNYIHYQYDNNTETRIYFLNKKHEVLKIETYGPRYIFKPFLRKKQISEGSSKTIFVKNEYNNTFTKSTKYYYANWEENRKGKKYSLQIDSNNFRTTIYNENGLVDSIYHYQIHSYNYKDDDTTIISTKMTYTPKFNKLTKVTTVYQNHQWYNNNPSHWNFIEIKNIDYNLKGQLTSLKCQLDSSPICSKLYVYTLFDSLETIYTTCSQDTFVEESKRFDSFNRLTHHYKTKISDFSIHQDPRNSCSKRIIITPTTSTFVYTYKSDGTYAIDETRTDLWTHSTIRYYTKSKELIKTCNRDSTCLCYTYDTDRKLLNTKSNNGVLSLNKYNQQGLLIQSKNRSYIDDEYNIIRHFYQFKE
jgi:hypothetical protein